MIRAPTPPGKPFIGSAADVVSLGLLTAAGGAAILDVLEAGVTFRGTALLILAVERLRALGR